jgi:hypothetical protein
MSGIDLQYVGVATARDVQGVFVLLNVHHSWFAAAAGAHCIECSAVLESFDAQIGCASSGSSGSDPTPNLHHQNHFRTKIWY